jgi:transposase-like protein
VAVFGLLKRNGKVCTRIAEDVSRKTLRQIIKTKVVPESVIYTTASDPTTGSGSTGSDITASTIRSASP